MNISGVDLEKFFICQNPLLVVPTAKRLALQLALQPCIGKRKPSRLQWMPLRYRYKLKMIRKAIFILVVFLLAGCEFLEIDDCLDRGGSWDYEEKQCIRNYTEQECIKIGGVWKNNIKVCTGDDSY